MKKLLSLFLLSALFLAGMAASQFFIVNKTDGSKLYFAISEVDSISFCDPQEHDYVDLGLPSGTLWATCNVGANSPEEDGDYFAWGETTPKSRYDWSTYKYGTAEDQLTKYCNESSFGLNGYIDTKTVLDPEDDAATTNWGNGWRMPTSDEFDELINNCSRVWTTQNGKYGRLFTGPNGNTLFLPAAGYYDGASFKVAGSYGEYWSSTLNDAKPLSAYCRYFNVSGVFWGYRNRYYGFSVRPVVKR